MDELREERLKWLALEHPIRQLGVPKACERGRYISALCGEVGNY
jgi:hypothetical protein